MGFLDWETFIPKVEKVKKKKKQRKEKGSEKGVRPA